MNGAGTSVLTLATATLALACISEPMRGATAAYAASQPPAGTSHTTVSTAQAPPVQPGQPPRPTDQDRRDRIAEVVAKAIDLAHGGAEYRKHPVFQCDIEIVVGDVTFAGTLAYQINGRSARFDTRDGTSILWNGQACSVTPASSELTEDAARLRLLTMRNLVALPFMTGDQHAKVSSYRASMVMGSDADAFKVNWPLMKSKAVPELIAYADSRSHEVSVIGSDAFPELFGLGKAGASVRGVVFTDITRVHDVLLPMTWWFYDWTEAATVKGERLGTAKISNVRFPSAGDVLFAIPNAVPARP